MAEFSEVMKQFDRMCKSNPGCIDCPLSKPAPYPDDCSVRVFINDPERIESTIMQWAAEHPEPVYPTWWEYLVKERILVPRENYTEYDLWNLLISQLKNTPIPADIAQKLGIEPKEGT